MSSNEFSSKIAINHSRKRWVAALVGGVAFTVAALAYAGVPKTWNDGDALNAADLNGNFASLDTRVTALETLTYVESKSNALESADRDVDLVYQSSSLALTPGTWMIHAYASAFTKVSPDQVQLGLWNDTSSTEVAGSRGSPAHTSAVASTNACGGPYGECGAVELTTSTVITVTAATTIKMKAFRNGDSVVALGSPGAAVLLPSNNRLTALKLK